MAEPLRCLPQPCRIPPGHILGPAIDDDDLSAVAHALLRPRPRLCGVVVRQLFVWRVGLN